MEESSTDIKCFDNTCAHFNKILWNFSFTVIPAFICTVYDIHDWFREYVGCLEDDVVILIYDTIEGNDRSWNKFFHDVLCLDVLLVEVFELFVVFDFPCCIGTNTIVWFDNDWISNKVNKLLSFFICRNHMVSRNWNICLFIVGFHV